MNRVTVSLPLSLLFILTTGCTRSSESPQFSSVSENPELVAKLEALSSAQKTAGLPDHCFGPDVYQEWELPIYWEQPGSQKFPYYFQFQKATVGDWRTAPIVVMIPGGAGAPSIGTAPGTLFPTTFNVINTDVRGIGCNKSLDNRFRPDSFTTDYFSRDVLSIVHFLRLRNYVLFGISYGTVQATVMTKIAEDLGIQTPKALILEGILGRWDFNNKDYISLNKEWNKIKPLIPASVVAAFTAEIEPYGIPSEDWGVFFLQALNQGTAPVLGVTTAHYLIPLASSDQDVVNRAIADIKQLVLDMKSYITPELVYMSTALHCKETSGPVIGTDFIRGEFVQVGEDICPAWGFTFDHPYDSADYRVHVPIYYFEGSADPNTTPESAAYHFDQQTETTRTFTLIWGGGHPAMSHTLHEAGCTKALFEAIALNPAGFEAARRACYWPTSKAVKESGQ